MKKLILKIIGADKIIAEQEKTNKLLSDLLAELKRNSDLVQAYNRTYHIH